MNFKKVEINGFKSFADKIEIKFTDGVTGIVGPNGCGKSNVADAIRFCLGESSSKTLRGGKMNDVIFAGTEKRKSLSFCEVSVTFNNRNRIFKSLDFDEVSFTRKLFGDNESEYYINKALCRKIDIIDALRDSGIGREGYSIIGQGKVEELISSKPEDRRAVFDEAVGISKYKARKIESQRKLKRANESIDRINDLLNYTNANLKPLIAEAEKARKYKEIYEKLKHHEINIYLHQYETTNETKSIILSRRNAVSAEIKNTQVRYDNASKAYAEARDEFEKTDSTLQTLNNELLRLSVSIERNQGDISAKRQSIQYFNQQIDTYKQELTTLEANLKNAEQILSSAYDRLNEKNQVLERSLKELEKKESEFAEAQNALLDLEGRERQSQKSIVEAAEKLADIKANMSKLIAEKEALMTSIEEYRISIKENKDKLNEAKGAYDSTKANLEKTKALLAGDHDRLDRSNAELEKAQKEISVINEKIRKAEAALSQAKTLKDLYGGFVKNNNILESSVRILLNHAETNKEIAKRIEGVIAKLIRVPQIYETAIETALGSAVHNIVTPTSEDASYLIEYLKSNSIGRATFLPMSDIRPRENKKELLGMLSVPGCYGVAADLVSYDEKYSNVVSNLLAGTVIVDDIKVGLSIARKTSYAFRIVTLDGDIIHQRGAMSGGSKPSSQTNIFSSERLYKENSDKYEKAKAEREALASEYALTSGRISHYTAECLQLQKNIHNLDVEEASLNLFLERASMDIETYSSLVESETSESEQKQITLKGIITDLDSVSSLEALVSSSKEDAAVKSGESESIIAEARAKRDSLADELSNLKLSISNIRNDISNIDGEKDRADQSIYSLKNRIEQDNQFIRTNEEDIARVEKEMSEIMATVVDDKDSPVVALRKKIDDFNDYKAQLNVKIAGYDAERNECKELLENLAEKKTSEELMLQKVDTDLEQMTERVTGEYQMTYEQCLPFRDESFEIDPYIAEAEKMRRQIDRLGEVHLDSIERMESTYQEYTRLETQRDDVIKAAREEEKIIENISKEMKKIFNEKFEQININFKNIFRELFNGGTASLLLLPLPEGETDELLAGVDIVAQPPSKNLQRLSLMSGGEKALTAIAILFAILQLRPMPFCILDEIEAALDDANALRFAKYLKRYSKATQFIVITHRKPTMELCDSLYGVTMEEKGVSKMVSVNLSDAVKLAD